jgi:hypothetical protein
MESELNWLGWKNGSNWASPIRTGSGRRFAVTSSARLCWIVVRVASKLWLCSTARRIASSSVRIAPPGFCARVCAEGAGTLCAGADCAPAVPGNTIAGSRNGIHQGRKRMGTQPFLGREHHGLARRGRTWRRPRLSGRGSRADLRGNQIRNRICLQRLRPGFLADRRRRVHVAHRQLNDLVTQVADGAGFRRGVRVAMPHLAQRRPDRECQDRCGVQYGRPCSSAIAGEGRTIYCLT